jgi:hypothetical protein
MGAWYRDRLVDSYNCLLTFFFNLLNTVIYHIHLFSINLKYLICCLYHIFVYTIISFHQCYFTSYSKVLRSGFQTYCFLTTPANKFTLWFSTIFSRCRVHVYKFRFHEENTVKWFPFVLDKGLLWFGNKVLVLCKVRSKLVGRGTILQAGRSPVRVQDEVDFSFNFPNPSSSTMALGSTQPLTEMSTRNLPRGK